MSEGSKKDTCYQITVGTLLHKVLSRNLRKYQTITAATL
jgi:hypothetical protein